MPSDKSIVAGLAVIESDKSKVLGVRVGKHSVEPGLLVPKAGMFALTYGRINARWETNTL